MKKAFITIILFLVLICTPFNFKFAKANTSQYTTYIYAQVQNDNTHLYKSNSSTSITNAYFAIPNSYFVLIISNMDEVFYKVQYKDIVGYVIKSQVIPVAETPVNPYLKNVTFRVYSSDGTNVLSSPVNTANAHTTQTINVLEEVEYYGQIIGDELIENRGNVWYYCKTKNNNYGYLYKGLSDNLSLITQNTENVTPISYPFNDEDNSYLYNLVDMSIWLKIIIIVLVSLPCVGIFYLLFKPINKNKKQKLTFRKNKLKSQTLNKIQHIIDDESL